MADPIEMLLARSACTDLIHRMARAIDRCDEAMLRDLYWPDGTDDHGIYSGNAAGFVDFVIPLLHGMKATSHHVSNILIEVDGDRARGETYFMAMHRLPGTDGSPESDMVAAGRYLDSFERRGGEWRFTRRHAVYDWSTRAPASDEWGVAPMKDLLLRGRRGETDASYAHFAGLRGC